MSDKCFECGGICCSFKDMNISWLTIDQPLPEFLRDEDDEYFEQLVFQDGRVPDMDWFLDEDGSIRFHCNHREDGKCTEYERRPEFCRAFECPILKGDKDIKEFQRMYGRRQNPDMDKMKDITELMKERIAEVEKDGSK